MINTPRLSGSRGPRQAAGEHPFLSSLAQATSILLDPAAFPLQWLEAVTLMFRIYSELAGIDDRALGTQDTVKTILPSGVAVAPRAAARCVLDCVRTAQFLRGLQAAIAEARTRFPGRTIQVLYAGCGPFAALALPLCTRFAPEEVSFTLIDIHQRSLDSARILAAQLGLAGYFREYICADAATYRHPEGKEIHVVVAEVMQCALDKEPQFAVTANLAPQLAPGGIFIPQEIAIDLAMADLRVRLDPDGGADPSTGDIMENTIEDRVMDRSAGSSESREPIPIHRLLELNATTAPVMMAQAVPYRPSGIPALPPISITLPDLPSGSEYAIVLLTTITLFKTIGIGYRESGLTMAKVLPLERPRGGEMIEARYMLGSTPGFRFQVRE